MASQIGGLSMNMRSWDGYSSCVPSSASGASGTSYRSLLRRMDSLRLLPWGTLSTISRCGTGMFISAHSSLCGVYTALPVGCGLQFCLHCGNRATSKKTSRLHSIVDRVAAAILQTTGTRPKSGRAVFTVHPEWQSFASSRSGSLSLAKQATSALCDVLGIELRGLPCWTSFHPTSSSKPWTLHPHVEVHWLHFDMENMRHLPSNRSILDVHDLALAWKSQRYGGSAYPHVDWIQNTKALWGRIRYALRPMTEDVWYALDEGRLSADIDEDTARSLAGPGGVTFWPHYRRYMARGWLADRGRQKRLEALLEPLGLAMPGSGPVPCPLCDQRECTVHFSEGILKPDHPDVAGCTILRFTLGKPNQNRRTERCEA